MLFTSCKKSAFNRGDFEGDHVNSQREAVILVDHETMESVFRGIGFQSLGYAMNDGSDAILETEFNGLVLNIAHFIKSNYDSSFVGDDHSLHEILSLGIAYLYFESDIVLEGKNSILSTDCILEAFGALLGVGEIRSLVNDFKNGVSATNIARAGGVMLRRVAGALAVALAVYTFVDCMIAASES